MSDLKQKTAKGMGWGFADNISSVGIAAIVGIVLARVLSPAEFGIMAKTTIFISLAGIFMDSGFSIALTRKKDADEVDFNTVFHTNLMLSAILYVILYISSPFIAQFFNTPILTDIIRILGLVVVIQAFSIVQKVVFTRKIDFKTQAIASLVASTVGGGLAILMAFKGFGVWSLVALQILKVTLYTLMLWMLSPWKPTMGFSWVRFKEFFSFSSKLLTGSVITVIWNEIYSLVIGKVYTDSILGFYARADKMKTSITFNVSTVMQKVSLPMLSTIQDEKERQVRAYRKVIKTTGMITFTALFGMIVIAKSFIVVLIGEKWLPAVHLLQILSLSGIFIPLMSNSVNVITANGKSNISLKLDIIKTLLSVFPILLGIFYTIEWMLYSTIATFFVAYMFHVYYVSKVIKYPILDQLKDLLPYLIIAVIMAFPTWFIQYIPIPQIFILLLQLIAGGAIIFFVYEVIYKSEEYRDIKGIVIDTLRKLRGRSVHARRD